MNRLQEMRLPALLGAMAAIGAGTGLAFAEGPDEHAQVQATAHRVDCASMPNTTAREASQLRGCYDVDVVSAPADATEIELAVARAQALCAAIADPAERPDACVQFGAAAGGEA